MHQTPRRERAWGDAGSLDRCHLPGLCYSSQAGGGSGDPVRIGPSEGAWLPLAGDEAGRFGPHSGSHGLPRGRVHRRVPWPAVSLALPTRRAALWPPAEAEVPAPPLFRPARRPSAPGVLREREEVPGRRLPPAATPAQREPGGRLHHQQARRCPPAPPDRRLYQRQQPGRRGGQRSGAASVVQRPAGGARLRRCGCRHGYG